MRSHITYLTRISAFPCIITKSLANKKRSFSVKKTPLGTVGLKILLISCWLLFQMLIKTKNILAVSEK